MKISDLSNINSVNVPFLCAGGRGMPVPVTMTEQTKTLRSTNKAHGKLLALILYYTNSVKKAVSTKMTCLNYFVYPCCST